VLESIPVYWLSLFKVTKSILVGLRKRITSFIWSGCNSDHKIHLANWNLLTRPKVLGGWGLCNLELFSIALRMKSLWRGLLSQNIWSIILKDKYLKGYTVVDWLRRESHRSCNTSIIW